MAFDDSTFEVVVAHHVLEHVPDVPHIMDEAWRVLAPGGRLQVHGPHFRSPDLIWSDPTHRRGLSIRMFQHFVPDAALPYSKARFVIRTAHLHTPYARPLDTRSFWRALPRPLFQYYEARMNRSPEAQSRAERIWGRWLPFDEVYVELEAVK